MLRILLLFFTIFFFENSSFSKEKYFLTLRNDLVNLRQGPSKEYPVKIIYKMKFLPVLIEDEYYNYRKIKDHENNSGWIHLSQLSKKKAAIIKDKDVLIFNSPTIYSRPLVVLKQGKLCLIIKCKNEWCKVKADGFKGWIKQKSLWGRL